MNSGLLTGLYICRGPEVYFSSRSFQERINHLTKLRSPVALGWPCGRLFALAWRHARLVLGKTLDAGSAERKSQECLKRRVVWVQGCAADWPRVQPQARFMNTVYEVLLWSVRFASGLECQAIAPISTISVFGELMHADSHNFGSGKNYKKWSKRPSWSSQSKTL